MPDEDALLTLARSRKMIEASANGGTLLLDAGHGFAWPPADLERASPPQEIDIMQLTGSGHG